MLQKDYLNNTDPITQLTALALENSDSGWGQVDTIISAEGFCDQDQIWEFATAIGLNHSNPNVWDLSASIIAGANNHKGQLSEQASTRLREILNSTDNPEATYARYRSAFALFEHNIRDQQILSVIQEAVSDEAVGEIAQDYLNQVQS